MKKKIDILTVKIVFVLMLSVIITGTVTYGFFIASKRQTGENKIASGCFNVVKKSESESLSLANAYSISDEEGMKSTPYTLTIENTCSIDAYYNLVIDTRSGSFGSEHINYSLDGGSAETLGNKKENTSYPAGTGYDHSYVIGAGTLKTGEEKTFTIRLWINSTTTYDDVQGKGWEGQVRIVNTVDALSPSARTLQALNLTSRGVRTDFDSPAPTTASYTDDNFSGSEINRTQSSTYQGYYYTYAENYTFDVNTGTYTLTNPQVCKYSECFSSLANKYIVTTTGSTSTAVASSSNRSNIYKVTSNTTLNELYYIPSSKTPVYDYSGDGIYEMEDDYGTSYYFRGSVENNYVRFGKWAEGTDKAGSDMYWRVIRVNGDGSLRMIYAGTSAHANDEQDEDTFIGESAFNNLYDDAKYVGYMYGPANEIEGTTTPSTSKEEAQSNVESSTIKKFIDEWYVTNLDADYGSYISDTLFCNERSTAETPNTWWAEDTTLGYGQNNTVYGGFSRYLDEDWLQRTNIQPTFKCPNKSDRFTKDDDKMGNASLDYPVGLITADETVAAGSGKIWNTGDCDYYLRRNLGYWSGLPFGYNGIGAVVSLDDNDNGLADYLVDFVASVAPVINLSAEYAGTLVGDGTASNPYQA